MQTPESIGGVSMDAEINMQPMEQGANKLADALDPLVSKSQQVEKSFNDVEGAAQSAGKSLNDTTTASQALSFAFAYLGVNSVQAVVTKIASLTQEAIKLTVSLQGVESRAKAIFGDAFPQMVQQTQKLAEQYKRSKDAMLDFATGFATILDSAGESAAAVQKNSLALTTLTVNLGKAFPDKSDADIFQIIQYGIEGNVRGLRQLGIVMSQKALQDEADRVAGGLKLKNMTDEQLVMLRTQFLLDQTTKLQQAGADSTGKLGDSAKSASDEWKELLTTLGTNIGPFINASNKAFVGMLTNWVKLIGDVKTQFLDIITLETYSRGQAESAKLQADMDLGAQNAALQAANGVGLGKLSKGQAPLAWKQELAQDYAKPDWSNHSDQSAAGKKLSEERAKLEKDITDSMDKQNKLSLDRMKAEKDELEIKQKMGTLSKEEEARLQAINNRLQFQKDKVAEASKEWENAQKEVDKYDKQIEALNKRIADEHQALQDKLSSIDEQAGNEKVTKAADVIRKINAIRAKASDPLNLSSSESYQIGDLQSQLKGYDSSTIEQATKLAGMNESQLIDFQTQQKKEQAQDDAKKRLDPLLAELKQAQANRDQFIALEAQKQKAVTDAINARVAQEQSAYIKEEADLEAHIKTTTEQMSRLASVISTPNAVARPAAKYAAGGPIIGPGGPTDDLIPILASNGEAIVNARGYSANRQIVDAINAGVRLSLPRFAQGGPVSSTQNNQRTATINNHYHGDAARVMGNPSMTWYHARAAMR